jgi:hypothetical protein
VLRDASELLYPAVQETIATLGLLGDDAAAVKLAQRYAKTIDGALDSGPKAYYATLRWLGPELLKTLAELGATPAAKAALAKKTQKEAPAAKTRLELLREGRKTPHG